MDPQPISIKNILDSIMTGISWKDLKGVYLGCNEYYAYLAGLSSPDEIKGMTDDLLPWRKQSKKIFNQEREIIKSNSSQISLEELLISDGTVIKVLVNHSPLRDAKNGTIGIASFLIDISNNEFHVNEAISPVKFSKEKKLKFYANLTKEITGFTHYKKNAEAYLAYIHDYLEKIIACMPGNVYWLDKNSVFLGCNDNVAKMLGLKSRTDIIGMTHAETAKLAKWSEGQAASFEKDDKEVIATGIAKVNVEEPPITDVSGREINFLTSRVPLRDTEDNVIGVVGISIDITERKKTEVELKQAKETAEIADRLKMDFIHNMEHDIRTPFWGILGLADKLAEQENDTEKKEMLLTIAKSAQELFEYCNFMLDFSNTFTDSKSPLIVKKFNLRELIDKILIIERPAVVAKKIDLTVKVKEDVPNILKGDPDRLHRILMNLIGNATKFTHEGYVKLIVLLAKKGNKSIILKFIIEDTGIGINEEKQKYIYEKFVRGTPSNAGVYKGLGLGLHIVKQYIIDMEGEIEVKSQEGSGATFTCTIPFELPLLESDAINQEPIRILLLEPDNNLLDSQANNLEQLGCVVDKVIMGKQAIELYCKNDYDIVFIGLNISDINSATMLKVLRNNTMKNVDVPIVGLIPHDKVEEYSHIQDINELINSPLDIGKCRMILDKYFSRFSANHVLKP